MKVLFLIESFRSGGKERRLLELIKGLLKIYKVDIQVILTSDVIDYEEILDLPITIHIAKRRFNKDPLVFFQFYLIAKKFNPDLINTWGNLVAFYSIPTKVLLRIPLINSQITDVPRKINRSILGPRTNFKFSDRIVSNSRAGLMAYGAPEERSSVIYNGFNFERLENLTPQKDIRQKFSIKGDFVIGMVASFSHLKDYSTFLKAAVDLAERYNELTFLCVGPGDSSEYRNRIQEDLKDRILFLGRQAAVESIMNVCDIGVLTSYNEGLPNSILEFCALSKAVIVTEGGGTSELVRNGENGFLIETGDANSLIDRIENLYQDSSKRKKMGEIGSRIAREKFSYTKMVNSYFMLFEEVSNQFDTKRIERS